MWSRRLSTGLFNSLVILLASLLMIGLMAVSPASVMAAPTAFTWPVDGEVITPYRNGPDPYAAGMHRGLDIAAPLGTTAGAAVAGSVTFSGRAPDGALTVTVRSTDGRYLASHLHLGSLAVRRHDSVAAGQPIGTVGRSGRPSSPRAHLHLGIRLAASGEYLDPLTLLPAPTHNAAASPVSARTAAKPAAVAQSLRGSSLPSEVVGSRRTARVDADATNRSTRQTSSTAPVRVNAGAGAGAGAGAVDRRAGGALAAPGLADAPRAARPEQQELKPLSPTTSNELAPRFVADRRQAARFERRPTRVIELAGLAITAMCALLLLWRRRHCAPTFPMEPPSNETAVREHEMPVAATGTRRRPD